MNDKEKTLKPCPFRVYGERQSSWTIEGEYYYKEWFMPCMEKGCACFHRDGDDAYCDRNGAYMRLTERRAGMMIDEAICLLAGYGANINPNNPLAEAVKMGIEALEGLSSSQPEFTKDTNVTTNDLIDRQAVMIRVREYMENPTYTRKMLMDELNYLPSAQPERKKGEWIIDEDCEGKSRTVTCNLCGYEEFNWHNPNFCSNCGADMRGEQE